MSKYTNLAQRARKEMIRSHYEFVKNRKDMILRMVEDLCNNMPDEEIIEEYKRFKEKKES